ncbi:MAG: CRISPR-associated endonuclease Cas2 [Chloroflexi bacterium]|nr:CRISPR-associated endonuclease Cas2 [Chloroflexota bacterium]
MLRVLVTYDITDDKARKKISDCCLDYGLDRWQYSVFSGRLKPVHIRALAKALEPLTETGAVLIVPIAADDWDKRIELGAESIYE